MRITIFAAGSRGDIQPCVLLGHALQRAGYSVLLAAPENFAGFVQAHGLPFHPLRGDVQQVMSSPTGRKFMEQGGSNPIAALRAMRTLLRPLATQMARDALAACRDADALISLAVFAPIAQSIADICQIPLLNLEPTPLLPTRDFPAPGWPLQRNLGGLHNRLSGHAMLHTIWLWYSPFVNDFRRRFGLPTYGAGAFYRILAATPLLAAYSPSVIPHPPDWSDRVHITGYWFADESPAWEPAPDLAAFLTQGDPPVYIGFGSMVGRDPEHLADLVFAALAESGRRSVLLTGWGALHARKAPENVFILDAAPHDRLFPHMAAVVHHGGAGTTAEGLRAGLPTLIIPFIVDQPFWGKRIHDLGVGPAPIPRQKLNVANLAQAIHDACTQPEMRGRATALGQRIRAEQGLHNAVHLVQHYLGT